MSPEEQARLLQDMKSQFIRGVADILTLKARADGSLRAGAGIPPTISDYLLDMSRLSVSFYQSVLDLNAVYWERLAARTGEGAPAGSAGSAAPAKVIHKRKAVVAARDEKVVFEVELENTSREAGTFRFLASDFTPIGSTSPEDVVRPPLKISPPRPLIAAGAKERIKIMVPISNILSAGKKYKGRISVRGPVRAEIVLRITVEDVPNG